MFNVKSYEYDCTPKCRYSEHGNIITAALTKRSIGDDKLAAYIAKMCCNYCDIVDDLGRCAVHMAASVDRYTILEWLLNQGAKINSQDYESGSSALHRAIYYGCVDCAVLLLRYGASLELIDRDTRCALQNVCRLSDCKNLAEVPANNELLVWGSNKNYNLGIGNDECATKPQFIDFFRKEQISIESVALGAYHSLFLDKKAQLYAVGHGKGGRLGINAENSLPTPKKVKVPMKSNGETVVCISVSRKHSLLLTNRSLVFACGLNEDQQLGVRNVCEKLPVFKEVITLRDLGVEGLLKVVARDFHSMAYSEKYIYVWGTNQGQLGMDLDVKIVPFPKQMKLPPKTLIQFVEANNFATACYTKENVILLFYNFKMRVLKPVNFEQLKSISIVGGDNTKSAKGSVTALKLLLLTRTNVIYIWYEKTQNFYRCSFSQYRITQIDKILYRANQVLILSQGDVYMGKCHQVSIPVEKSMVNRNRSEYVMIWSRNEQNRTELSKDQIIRIDLQRFCNIDRAVDIFVDEDFSAFAVLQESYAKYFKLPALIPMEYSFKKLLIEVSEFDSIHDIVFHVDSEVFYAHKLIVFSRSVGLEEIVNASADKHIYLKYKGLTGRMFEVMLKYIYSNYFPSEQDIDSFQQSLGPECPSERSVIYDLFLGFAQQFKLFDLANFIQRSLTETSYKLASYVDKSKYRFKRLHPNDYPSLYDVRIVCADGVKILTHKCILVARLEYFDMMFTHSWAEQTTINLTTVPIEYMQPIVDFLYTLDVDAFRRKNYSETFLYNMIVFCDQFFIERLRKVCEILILDKITIRKCGDMLDFANVYNCDVLKRGCLDFICQNLARVLAHKSLESCESMVLKCINDYYRQMFKDVFAYRMITPSSLAVSDQTLLRFVDNFTVDLSCRMDENEGTEFNSNRTLGTKHKPKENITKQSTRHYELEAISSMIDAISLKDSAGDVLSVETKSKITQEAENDAEKFQEQAKNWVKVTDKKDIKKTTLAPLVVAKGNEVLRAEEKQKGEFVNLSTSVEKATPPFEMNVACSASESSPPSKVYNFNLADFTSPIKSAEKLSQKQRKRLSSESWRSVDQTKPVVVAKTVSSPNAWGVVSSPPTPSSSSSSVPATGSPSDSFSFANVMRCKVPGQSYTERTPGASSFAKILADEKKQREYYERMRTKSLALTQIEETAISELRDFYNVDNVGDEIISIERKSLPQTLNFAVWQKN